MSALTLANPLPSVLVAISAEHTAALARLDAEAKAMGPIDSLEAYKAADALLSRIVAASKAIEADRAALKRPIIDLGRALDELAGEALAPLLGHKASIGRRLVAFQEQENARREAERQRIEAERRAAEEAAAAEAKRLAEAEAARVAAAAVASPWDDVPEAVAPETAPWDEPEKIHTPIVYEPLPEVLKSSAVVRKTVREVVIVSPELVPREVAGIRLWSIDEKVLRKAALAGVQIPGVIVKESTTIVAKGNK
jgi:hypothetical protein